MTMMLKSGYSGAEDTTSPYNPMTVAHARKLQGGDHVSFQDPKGNVRQAKVNGQPKTWKTRPHHIRVPIKYGMYEYAYAESYGESDDDIVLLPTGQPLLVAS